MSELHQVWPDPLAATPLVPTCEGHVGFESLALMLQGSRGVLAIDFYACLCSSSAESNLPRNPLTWSGKSHWIVK